MAERNALTAENLERLGAGPLARALVDYSEDDPVLRRKLRLLLVGAASPDRLAVEIARRMDRIGRSRSNIDADQGKVLARELGDLRRSIVDQLLPARPGEAVERLWQLLGMAPAVLGRVVYGGDRLTATFARTVEDLGRACAGLPGLAPLALADRVMAALDAAPGGLLADLLPQMAEALGAEGRAAIRTRSLARLAALPAGEGARAWRATAERMDHVGRLLALADIERDVDAYMAGVRAGGMEGLLAEAAAERLLAAARPREALEWLDAHPSRLPAEAHLELRLAALEGLGQGEAAQALRWRYFETHLSHRHLRDHLKKLPDFADFEAEQRALDFAAAHPDAVAGLDFLVQWPDLARAERLVRDRFDQLDGRRFRELRSAAQALDARWPLAATRLRRLVVETVLAGGWSDEYTDALVDLLDAAGSAARIEGGDMETHQRFTAHLRQRYGRKYKFWSVYDQTL